MVFTNGTIGTNGITNGTIGKILSDIGIPLVPLVEPWTHALSGNSLSRPSQLCFPESRSGLASIELKLLVKIFHPYAAVRASAWVTIRLMVATILVVSPPETFQNQLSLLTWMVNRKNNNTFPGTLTGGTSSYLFLLVFPYLIWHHIYSASRGWVILWVTERISECMGRIRGLLDYKRHSARASSHFQMNDLVTSLPRERNDLCKKINWTETTLNTILAIIRTHLNYDCLYGS